MASIHAGHRKRLRARAKAEGLRSFEPHEVIELLLTQVIPLRDVNPLAHRIIDRFGTVEAALTAPEEELMQISGVGERSAKWLRAAGEMALAYGECWYVPGAIVHTSAQAIGFLQKNKLGHAGDYILVCLDRTGRVLHHVKLDVGEDGLPRIREMVRAALMHHAVQVFTVHYAFALEPRRQDTEFSINASMIFALMEIMHLDHIIAVKDVFFSARREGIISYRPADDTLAAENESAPKK